MPTFSADRHRLRSSRLDLEPIAAAHADEAWPHLDDERLWTYFPALRPQSLERLRETYARRARGYPDADGEQSWGNWLLRDRATGGLVGDVQATIYPKRRVAYIAYSVYVAFQGNGFGREAARVMIEHLRDAHAIEAIQAEIDEPNAASRRLAESLGLERIAQHETECLYELRFPIPASSKTALRQAQGDGDSLDR
ncbi:MAG TPA: GNAT family N-acetyltransferase [Candidatus Baltobacteraceae bacterium]